ncbi:MAG: C25 family cysteine peptidase, partial [Bacteroidales bacterium]|nr:C25 family cysteine peptidase [Bacteroidales bacterium]
YLNGHYSEDALLFFDNYEGLGFEQTAMYKGRYAILTKPSHVQTLQRFVDYKTNMGYDVDVYANEYDVMGAGDTRAFLKTLYDNPDTRPRFVLLVGNNTEIPMSAGVWEDTSNPPTDIYYACLNYNNPNAEDKNLTPSVHVGRWPITEESEIINITNKTIKTELGLGDESRINLQTSAFSGIGNPNRQGVPSVSEGRAFLNSLQNIQNKAFNQISYTFTLVNGMTISNPTSIISQRLANNTWITLYRGHGGFNQLGAPYLFGQNEIIALNQTNVDYFPFSFAFACNTGGCTLYRSLASSLAFYNTCYDEKGMVSHFGASVKSRFQANNKSSLSIFSQLLDQRNRTITSMTIDGMSKYFLNCKTDIKRKQLKKYNFFGDPSLYIYGLNRFTGNPISAPSVTNNHVAYLFPSIANTEIFVSNSTKEDVFEVKVYNTLGVLMFSSNEKHLNVSNWPNGIYIALLLTENSQTIVERFIVKHNN